MLQSVGGLTAPVGTQEQTWGQPTGASSGGSFSSYLTAAMESPEPVAASASASPASGQGQAASGLNPLPPRGWLGDSFLWPAKAPEEITSFNPLDWAGAYKPPKGGGDSGGLGQAISSYAGGRFPDQVDLGPAERVGGEIFQFHFPHMVKKDGLYYAYFIDHAGGSLNDVGLATSADGVNWDYQGKVLRKGAEFDALQASFPGVAYDQDTRTWYMLYEGKSREGDVNSVCLATSKDGREWSKQGPVITPGQAGDMSSVDAGTPTLFKENGTWHVYFHGLGKDGRVRIGYASGTDLKKLTVKNGPLIDVDASGDEAGTVGARSNVVKIGAYYYMAYETCSGVKDFSQAQWGTSLARSTRPDGGWEKIEGGPIIENPRQGFGYDGPELSVQDGELYLYYRLPGNGTARRRVYGLG